MGLAHHHGLLHMSGGPLEIFHSFLVPHAHPSLSSSDFSTLPSSICLKSSHARSRELSPSVSSPQYLSLSILRTNANICSNGNLIPLQFDGHRFDPRKQSLCKVELSIRISDALKTLVRWVALLFYINYLNMLINLNKKVMLFCVHVLCLTCNTNTLPNACLFILHAYIASSSSLVI